MVIKDEQTQAKLLHYYQGFGLKKVNKTYFLVYIPDL